MDLGINGRVALITGAEGGMGLATARLLAAEGVKLVLTDKRIGELEREAREIRGEVLCVGGDATVPDDMFALAKAAVKRFGRLDIVVHTSGITGAKGDPLQMTNADYEDAWRNDFLSAVNVARATFPAMKVGRWGRFVCVTSENAVQPYWEEATYNAAKAALAAFVKDLSYKSPDDGILCNTVAPAFIRTKMTDAMMEKRANERGTSVEEAVESFLAEERAGLALKRRGEAEEVASVIALLVSERASFVNGANYRVDGGSVTSVGN